MRIRNRSLLEAIAHADLSDMPDVGGTNTDHDARYFKLTNTTDQTIILNDNRVSALWWQCTGKNLAVWNTANGAEYFEYQDDVSLQIGTDGNMVLKSTGADAQILAGADSSGILTLGGTGGTNNENLTLDFESVANRAILSTSSGVTDLDFRIAVLVTNGASFSIFDGLQLRFGSSNDISQAWETEGNDNFQVGLKVGSADYSGYYSIMEQDDMGHANRSPSGTTANPTLRIYSSDETSATDYIEMYHDQTDAHITTGAGDLKLSAAGGDIDCADDNITTTGIITGTTFSGSGTSLTGVSKLASANTHTVGTKNTFQSSATTAGLNLGGLTGNPSGAAKGDVWYNTSTDRLMYYGTSSREVVARTLAQTLTTKTIALGSNTVSGTKAQFDTACTDGNFAYSGGAFHDGFSDFVAAEHYDWTNETHNFLTTGSITGGNGVLTQLTLNTDGKLSVTGNDLKIENVTADEDILFYANDSNGGGSVEAFRVTGSSVGYFGANAQGIEFTANFGSIDKGAGTQGNYYVYGNRYAFMYGGATAYGLFFNSSSAQYEFRGASGAIRATISANANYGIWSSGFVTLAKPAGIATPATGEARIYVDPTTGDLRVRFDTGNSFTITAYA